MANKELTARIKLDTSDAESKLKRLDNLIKSINKAVTGNANTNKLESALTKQVIQAEKAKQATLKTEIAQEKLTQEVAKTYIAEEQVNQALAKTAIEQERVKQAVSKTAQEIGKEYVAEEKVNQALAKTAVSEERVKQATIGTQIAKQKLIAQHARTQALLEKIKAAKEQVKQKTTGIVAKIREWATHQKMVNSATKSTNTLLDSAVSKVKRLASTYLGILGLKAAINTSDTLTSTQNKLNNLNGGDKNLTQEQMDKMYASANKVRMAYTDMAANASKSMTLAGDAFQGSMDNAIRFQEIMAETYALGGASAEEMSTSMYQMIQALGSGTLAGDELRSVREGAPLAYKAIEQFAQGVYNTDESLKQLAADGKITSQMVVAAVMNAGSQIDEQFENTAMTFGQAWDRIKNAAVKAFEPVGNALNEMLNKAAKNGAFEKIEAAFWEISKVIQIVFKLVENTVLWIVDNWDWIKNVIITGLILLAGYFAYLAGKAVASAIATVLSLTTVQWTLIIIIAAVAALIFLFLQWKSGAIDTCSAITYAILVVAVAVALVAALFGAWPVVLVAVIVAMLAIIFMFLEEVMGGIFVAGAFIKNVWYSVGNFIIAIWEWLKAVWNNFMAWIVNVATACGNALSGIFENVGIWWNNVCADMKSAFWDFIASCLEGVSGLAPVIEAVASAFGKEISISGIATDARGKASAARATRKEYVDISAKWNEGMNTKQYTSLSEAWKSGMNTYKTWEDGWVNEAFNNGYEFGAGIKDAINKWGSKFQTTNDKESILDSIAEKLGLDFGALGNGFPSANDPAYDTSNAYNPPSNEDLLNSIKDDTGSIAKSMDLSKEDLDYLRKVAEMEWKKEFTTASIKIDMTNNNTVNGESDLDGIVTKLADKLYEEMNVVANGVYA